MTEWIFFDFVGKTAQYFDKCQIHQCSIDTSSIVIYHKFDLNYVMETLQDLCINLETFGFKQWTSSPVSDHQGLSFSFMVEKKEKMVKEKKNVFK